MLTEGWDANTVTHVLGIRAFGTQLLCEQVVGRALRRASYDPTPDGMFEPEYAEVLGVPFTFLTTTKPGTVRAPKPIQTVRALPERSALRIEFPRVIGYRYEMPAERLTATFDEKSVLELSTREVPTQTELDPIVGEMNLLELPLDKQRLNTVVFAVAKRTLDTYFKDLEGGERPWLFPQLTTITRRWLDECVIPYVGDGAYPQLLLLAEWSHAAAEKIHRAIVMGTPGEKRMIPILRPYDAIGSTDDVYFETTKVCFDTTKSHINQVAQDSGWETELAPEAGADARGRRLRQEPGPQPQDPVHLRGPRRQLRAGLPHPPAGSPRHGRRRPAHAVARGLGRGEEGEAGQGGGRRGPLDPGDQQLGRPRALGVPRGHAHGERGGPDPVEVPRGRGGVGRVRPMHAHRRRDLAGVE